MSDDDLRQAIREELEPLREQMTRLDRFITGGEKPEEGLLIRLDRLEQADASRSRWLWALATGLAGIAAERVWGLMTGRHG